MKVGKQHIVRCGRCGKQYVKGYGHNCTPAGGKKK